METEPKLSRVYLVGGAVRDELLGLAVSERDWVVLGETPDRMSSRGFRQVGLDFPVFLHPETGEEYALARKERKSGSGYHGFFFDFCPSISLEEDLIRRDLTVNAMARSADGVLIDPYGGLKDLKNRILRHVSPAFIEDPLRVLRVARFAARFNGLGFSIAPETLSLMRQIARSGELQAVVPERIFLELQKALKSVKPRVFFEVLRRVNALAILFPEVEALFGVPQRPDAHPEIDVGIHSLDVLDHISEQTSNPVTRFAGLTHDLGKSLTNSTLWPNHRGHEVLGLVQLDRLAERLRVPRDYRGFAAKVMRFHVKAHDAFRLQAEEIIGLFEGLDLYRQPLWLQPFLDVCHADSMASGHSKGSAYPEADFLRVCFEASQEVGASDVVHLNLKGAALGKAIREYRVKAIKAVMAGYPINIPY